MRDFMAKGQRRNNRVNERTSANEGERKNESVCVRTKERTRFGKNAKQAVGEGFQSV